MNILVFRFSAMGDVALAIPVIKAVLKANPGLKIWFVSKPGFEFLFEAIPECTYIPIDFKEKFKGLRGLYRAHQELHRLQTFDVIIDLHDVLRTWILCKLGSAKGIPYFRINKGRKEKQLLTRKLSKDLKPLKHSTQRYLDVFSAAGLKTGNLSLPAILPQQLDNQTLFSKAGLSPKTTQWVGIAPFSKHQQKEWPLAKIKALMQMIIEDGKQVILFGGGKKEISSLDDIVKAFPKAFNVAGKFDLREEVVLLTQLDAMIAMDSFNMHLATLAGCPVISIWGATHPFTGFGPLGENVKHIIQVDPAVLNCRPCSVFGNKTCWRGDLACLEQIEVNTVFAKLNEILQSQEEKSY